MTDDISRRRLLETSGGALGGFSVLGSRASDAGRATSGTMGWVTKGSRAAIDGSDGTVETFRYFGSSLCNDGDSFKCRTCDGATFYLLVPVGSGKPTVGDTYRFSATGNGNFCGNFQVRLSSGDSCGNSATASDSETETDESTDDPETATETTTETTTEVPDDPETEPTTTEETETTTETAEETEMTEEESDETTSE